MKNTKTIVCLASLLLITAMTFSIFAACKKTDEQLLIGKWLAVVDFSGPMRKLVEKEYAETGIDISDMDFRGVSLKIAYTFEQDGSFKAETDKESVRIMVRRMGQLMGELFKKTFQQEGLSISDSEMLNLMGVESWEDFGARLMNNDNIDLNGLTGNGTYTIEDGKLKLLQQVGDGKMQKYDFGYMIGKAELKFISVEADGMSEDEKASLAQTLPIVLKRAE